MIFRDLVGRKLPGICLIGEKKSRKNSPKELVPTGDRIRTCCVTDAHATSSYTAVDKILYIALFFFITREPFVQEMIQSLGYRKLVPVGSNVYWPKITKFREEPPSKLFFRYFEMDMIFISILTGDESWFHYYEPETERQSMEWHHLDSATKNKTRTVQSAGEVTGSIFWDAEDCIMAEFL